MSRRIRKSHERSRCASLAVERLEDRILLSWTQPAVSPLPRLSPALTAPASPQPATSGDVSSSDSSPEANDNYAQNPPAASTDWADSASTSNATTGEYAHAAAVTTSSPAKPATVSNVDYGGGGYVAAGTSGSASGAGSESAFSYYGQQPFYRLPPDQISAYRATGLDMPQAAPDTGALIDIVANQDNPNSSNHATAADAATRRIAEVLVVTVAARGIGVQHPAPEDGRIVVAEAPAEAGGPLVVAAEPAQADAAVAPLALSLLPSSGQVAAGMLPVDLAALERGVEQFFGQMARLGDHVSGSEAAQRLAPWLVAVALSTAALETARWRFWKAAPGTPVLAGNTRGFSTIHPSGTDPFPDAS